MVHNDVSYNDVSHNDVSHNDVSYNDDIKLTIDNVVERGVEGDEFKFNFVSLGNNVIKQMSGSGSGSGSGSRG